MHIGDDKLVVGDSQTAFAGPGNDEVKITGSNTVNYGGAGDDTYIIDGNITNTVLKDVDSNNNFVLQNGWKLGDLVPTRTPDGINVALRDGKHLFSAHNVNGALSIKQISIGAFTIALDKVQDMKVLDKYEQVYSATDLSEWIVQTHNSAMTIYGGNGDDIIIGYPIQTNSLNGQLGNDILIGGEYSDFLDGGEGDDILYGGAGIQNRLIGGSGNDVLYGGSGKDIFILDSDLKEGNGKDVIYNFDIKLDKIDLSEYGFQDNKYLSKLFDNAINDSDGNASLVDYNKFHITLKGIAKEQLTFDMFTFAFLNAEVIQAQSNILKGFHSKMKPILFLTSYKQFKNAFQDYEKIKLPEQIELIAYEFDDNALKSITQKAYIGYVERKLMSLPYDFHKAYNNLYTLSNKVNALPQSQEELNLEKLNFAKLCRVHENKITHTISLCDDFREQFVLKPEVNPDFNSDTVN